MMGGQEVVVQKKDLNTGKDSSIRGRDPLGAHDKRKGGSGSPKIWIALAHYDPLKKSLGKVSREDRNILYETN